MTKDKLSSLKDATLEGNPDSTFRKLSRRKKRALEELADFFANHPFADIDHASAA